MKKLIAMILALTMAFAMVACAKTEAPETIAPEVPEIEAPVDETPAEPEAPVEETPAEGEEEAPADEAPVGPGLVAPGGDVEMTAEQQELSDKITALTEGVTPEMATMVMPVPAENYNYQLFIDYIEGSNAVSSDAMMSAQAHSVVLLQLPEDADAEAVAEEIRTNMDPRKWICVEAEAADVLVSGQYVLLVMTNQADFDTISANFETVFGA